MYSQILKHTQTLISLYKLALQTLLIRPFHHETSPSAKLLLVHSHSKDGVQTQQKGSNKATNLPLTPATKVKEQLH